MEETNMVIGSAGFKQLSGKDDYTRYFNQLGYVFEKLLKVFDVLEQRKSEKSQSSFESTEVSNLLQKMHYTIEAFRQKYTYNPDHDLKIDLTESGFFSEYSLRGMTTDLLNRESRLADLPSIKDLKNVILDYIFEHKNIPAEMLWKISERAYYDMLDKDKLMLTFTPGSMKLNYESDKFRGYTYSWSCFDFRTNRPYIYTMIFDQDIDSVPLENLEQNYRYFMEKVEEEGSRAPELLVVAVGIDRAIKDIHPKALKRVCVGPVYMKKLTNGPKELSNLLSKYSDNADDFILMFEDEIVLSINQQISWSIFSMGQLRETFYIPELDIECYERKVSKIHKYMLLPHSVRQHMSNYDGRFKPYENHEMISYVKKGGIYVK